MNDDLSFFSLHSFAKSHINSQLIHAMKPSSICTRSIAAVVALSLAAIAAPSASAQTTATTVPVGFITATIPAAPSLTNPSNAVVSIPLYQTAVFQSTVATVGPTATKFTMSGAAFGNLTTVPHLVRVKTSVTPSHVGKTFLISANTATELTVSGIANVSTAVSVGDACEVVPASTLAKVFQSVLPQIKKSSDPLTADNVLIWTGVTWGYYYYDPTGGPVGTGGWQLDGDLDPQDNTVIYPDEAVFIIRRLTTPLSLVLMGTVPSTAEKTDIAGGTPSIPGYTFISNRFPVGTTFGSLALQTLPGWISGVEPTVADKALLWNGTTWSTFFYDPTNGGWQLDGDLDPQNNTPIPATSALFVVRRGGATQTLAQALPYVP